MKKLTCLLTTLVLLLGNAIEANSASFKFEGNFTYQKDIVKVGFTIAKKSSVNLFTDSYNYIESSPSDIDNNFDPVAILWDAKGNFIDHNDDIDIFNDILDAGFLSKTLLPGDYFLTLLVYDNDAKTGSLADGFMFDDEPAELISDFANSATGTFWRLNLEDVDSAAIIPTSAVPLPAAVWMFGSALMGFAGCAKRNAINKTRLSA